ncbi:MAG TPA: tetratricopeptide repeat protein, partial [Longimicrobium sp.]|nr:tetratricopeptide repeat protein [Longimicrobium sp.]
SLRAPLTALADMLATPESVPAETVSSACTDVARWAEEEGYDNTALAYTQSAAVASPRNAVLALAVGQLARRRAELARAETWFRHTVMVARQTGDWDSYSRAYMALGNMLVRRGNFPAAHRMHIKALRAARRKGLANVQGMALHDLFVIATETGRAAQAEEYARQAFRAYGNGHSSIPALVHDVAYYWMNEGYFARAQPVLEAVLPHFVEPGARFKVQSNIARAAGGNGDRNTFRRYWAECTRLMKEPFAKPYAADALVELALGATSLAEWDRAEQLATRAAEVAAETGGSKAAFRAEWILDSVRKGRQVEKRVAAPAASSPAEKLAEQFLSSLAPA